MTDKELLELAAKACGSDDCILNEPDKDGNFYMHYIELERFYRLAQSQALREAAAAIYKGMPPNRAREMLRALADELESK